MLLSLSLLLACGDVEVGAGWTGSVDTLPSGAVHVTSPAEGLWGPGEEWTLVEELRIGTLDGEGPEVFADVNGLEVDREGRIYVLDGEAGEVRVFDAEGGHVRTLGGSGRGPGELERPVGLDWVEGEGLWVPDMRNARFTLFGPEGELVRSVPRQVSGSSFTWRGAVTEGGEIVDFGFVPREDGFLAALLRLDGEGRGVDTAFLPAYEAERFILQGSSFTLEMTVPFSPDLVWRYHPDGYLWFGVSDRYRLYRRALDGDTLQIVERGYEPVPVTPEERAEEEEDLGDRDVDLSRIPREKPAFDAIFWDDAGRLWIRAEGPPEDEDRLLDVFDTDGRYLGRVRSPVPIRHVPPPVIREDAIWAVTRGELDVRYVVRLGIRRPGGDGEGGG